MLSSNSITTVWPLAEKLATLGYTARPRNGTIIEQLVRTIPTEEFINIPLDEQPEISGDMYGCMIKNLTTSSNELHTPHTLAMDACIADISKYVLAHISFAKNIVKPLVIEFADRINKELEIFNQKKATDSFDIEIKDYPEILDSTSFMDDISSYRSSTASIPTKYIEMPSKSLEEVLELLLVGSKEVDNLIISWYSRLGSEFIKSLWNSFFCQQNKNGLFNYGSLGREDIFTRCDIGLFLYLIGSKLYNNVEDIKGISLDEYKIAMSEIRDYGGSILYSSIESIDTLDKNETLVISIKNKDKKALVYGKKYKEWLKAGGKPEVILGLIVSNRNITDIDTINHIGTKLEEEWKQYELIDNNYEMNKRFSTFKLIVKMQYNDIMQNLTETEKEYVNESDISLMEINKKVDNIIDDMCEKDMCDIYHTSLKIIAKGRFYYTSSYDILNSMDKAKKNNPDISPREAALIATIEYISDYVVSQFELSK